MQRDVIRLTSVGTIVLAALLLSACRGVETGGGEGGEGGARSANQSAVKSMSPAPARWAFGRTAARAQIAAWNTDVNPAGVGLPPGSGTAAQGAGIYAAKCAVCHGAAGEGIGPYPKLIQPMAANDSFPFDRDANIPKTIGNYWPYSTTVYEYISRAMPFNAPGSLTPDEVYSVAAYLLAKNGVIGQNAVMNAKTLPAVRMPAHDRFVRDDRHGGPGFR